MSTPPPTGNQGMMAALRQLTMQMQAMLHQQQTLSNLSSGAAQMLRQARQRLTPQGPIAPTLLGGQIPVPTAPTAQWVQRTAMSLLSQVALNRPQQRPGPQPGSAPSPTPPTPSPVAPPIAYPNPYLWQAQAYGAHPYNGPAPGPYPAGPVVAPHHSGAGSGASTGIGSWVRSSLPSLGARIGGPWGAVAGAAAAAATQIPAEVRSQRDKNAYYQSIEGGDNFDGFGERLHEEAYRWTTFGVLNSEEARRAFKGVTRLGYNSKIEGGPGRQDALDFVYHGKTSYGATVDESLQELQVASKLALTSFKELSSALKDVSNSAGKAGVNAQMARAEYTQLLDKAIKSGYGSSAPGVAQLEQQTKNSYGRSFQDMDVSGRLSSGHAYMAASVAGMSVTDYLTSGPTKKAAADQKLDNAAIQAVLKPGSEAWIKQQIAASGGDVSEQVAAQIGQDLLRQFYPNDPFALASVVGALSGNGGLAKDPVKAATWIVQQYNAKGTAATAKEMSKDDLKAQKEASKKNSVITGVGETARVPNDRGPNAGKSSMGEELDREHEGGFLGFGGDNSDAYNAYQDWHEKNGGQEDPVVYNLLNAIKGDNESKVAVSTKSGKRVVSLAEAIKKHRNELASGKAVIVEGDQAGKTVGEILGKDKVDPLRDYSKEAKAEDTSGESYEAWEKKHTKKDKKGGSGRLEISLTAEARRLLTVLDTTGVSGSSATANPPLSPYASNPSYQE